MSWERRQNGMYYYRRRKTQHGLLRDYIGAGPIAEFIADLDELERAESRDRQRQEAAIRRHWFLADQAFKHAQQMLNADSETRLLSLGYRRQNRGPWRKLRRSSEEKSPVNAVHPSNRDSLQFPCEPSADTLALAETAWLELISHGDEAVLASLRDELGQLVQRLHLEGDDALATMHL